MQKRKKTLFWYKNQTGLDSKTGFAITAVNIKKIID